MAKEDKTIIPEPEAVGEKVVKPAKSVHADKVDVKRFIARKLKTINENPNGAKAKRDAERVLRNNRRD